MTNLSNKEKLAVAYVAINHLIGFIGLNFTPYTELFAQLTPINLLVTSAVILLFHKQFNFHFILFFLVSFTVGFMVEVMGVHTGQIFGEYEYSSVLGPALFNVPLMIGVNWFLLLYCIGALLHNFSFSNRSKAIMGAALMVVIDFVIEPFAIEFNLWQWTGGKGGVPLQNYIAWFAISFALFTAYYRFQFDRHNKVAALIYPIMFFFFFLNIVV
jgi:uncharacterized membrane protein